VPLTLVGRYECSWRDYATATDSTGRIHRWRYLHISTNSGTGPAVPVEPAGQDGGAREAVLAAARRLAARSPDGTFTPAEVVAECQRQGAPFAVSTIRTHVISVMCRDAPDHHARRFADLDRATPGRYRLADGE
jgi:hypothetical protein